MPPNRPCLRLRFLPLGPVPESTLREVFHFDLTIEGELVASEPAAPGAEEVVFAGLPAGDKVVELWLLQEVPVAVVALESEKPCTPVADERPRWVTYGSSLTHCVRAHSPARTWPAIVARRRGLHLTSLGFGGQCHLDGMVGMLIRELPADYITLKIGD